MGTDDRPLCILPRTSRPCALMAVLCVLASLLVPGIASASTAPGAETRVWAFDRQNQVGAEVEPSLTLELHRGCAPREYDSASGSLLAARGGWALSDAHVRAEESGR